MNVSNVGRRFFRVKVAASPESKKNGATSCGFISSHLASSCFFVALRLELKVCVSRFDYLPGHQLTRRSAAATSLPPPQV
jgi:hypothetical protein